MTEQDTTALPVMPPSWRVFHATGQAPAGEPPGLPSPPPWRVFSGSPLQPAPPDDAQAALRRLGVVQDGPQLREEEIDAVNAALLLRRPLLITGPPGVGKSTLAYLIARELGLGRVLPWSIVSRTTLRGGLYEYDAIGRAQAIAAWRAGGETRADVPEGDHGSAPDLGDFLTLGPLGTALLAYERPRVLLVDELDKSDIDLPNDLLHVLENGSFDIPELVRTSVAEVSVFTDDPERRAVVRGGRVECVEFPVVVITSNGEREFPAAFRRRCPAPGDAPAQPGAADCHRGQPFASTTGGSRSTGGRVREAAARRWHPVGGSAPERRATHHGQRIPGRCGRA